MKEQRNINKQHTRQLQYEQLPVEERLRTCGDEKFMFPFVKNLQEKKLLRKFYERCFIDKCEHSLNK